MATKQEFLMKLIDPLATKGGWNFSEEQVSFLYYKLNNASTDELSKAADNLIESMKRRPSIAEVISTVKKEKKTETFYPQSSQQEYPWEKKRRIAKEMAEVYANNFLLTVPISISARESGWEIKLRECVYNIALIQSQIINGITNISFSCQVLPFPYDPAKVHSWVKSITEYAKSLSSPEVLLETDQLEYLANCYGTKNEAELVA